MNFKIIVFILLIGTSWAQVTQQNKSKNSTSTVPQAEKTITYSGLKKFKPDPAGEISYYPDKARKAWGIRANIESHRGPFARATLTFDEPEGIYDFAITALKETDGECTYRLLINGTLIGSGHNDPSKKNYAPQDHSFKDIKVPAGATISVESNAHSNGKELENKNEPGIYAWARGRWTTLTMVPKAPAKNDEKADVKNGASTPADNDSKEAAKITDKLKK